MRTLSNPALAAMTAQETDAVFLCLVTITHADLEHPIRVVNNIENITSRGDTFVALPFAISLPEEGGETLGVARLVVDNIDQQIVTALRTIMSPPTVMIEIILAGSPDTVELSLPNLVLRQASYTLTTVTGVLAWDEVMTEPVAESITAFRFPALY